MANLTDKDARVGESIPETVRLRVEVAWLYTKNKPPMGMRRTTIEHNLFALLRGLCVQAVQAIAATRAVQ